MLLKANVITLSTVVTTLRLAGDTTISKANLQPV